jgi:two-component system sensor histidine kinase KdpD
LALRQAAHEVGQRLISADQQPGVAPCSARKHHKILVLVTADPKTAMLIRRAKRVSDFMDADCFAVAIQPGADSASLPQPEREALDQHLNFARNLHIETRILDGDDIASTIVDFARRNQITQIYLTRPQRKGWIAGVSKDPAQKIIGLAKDMQIVVVSDREPLAH